VDEGAAWGGGAHPNPWRCRSATAASWTSSSEWHMQFMQSALNKIYQLQRHLGLPFIYIYQNIYLKRSIKAYHPQT
jgi:hypothetical protein